MTLTLSAVTLITVKRLRPGNTLRLYELRDEVKQEMKGTPSGTQWQQVAVTQRSRWTSPRTSLSWTSRCRAPASFLAPHFPT